MSDILKCPYCGGILEQTSIYNLNSYACTDLTCKGYYMNATKDMWQELIRTRKALDVAVDALKRIKEPTAWGTLYQEQEIATETLEQITALEQKDVK